MQTQSFQDNPLESNKKTINNAIRICVNCGNVAIKIQNHGIFCKDCGSFFNLEEKIWVKICVGVFVDIMMQKQNIEIHKLTCLENIALYVIWN